MNQLQEIATLLYIITWNWLISAISEVHAGLLEKRDTALRNLSPLVLFAKKVRKKNEAFNNCPCSSKNSSTN